MRVDIFRHFSPEKRGLLIFQFPKNLFKVLIKGIKKDTVRYLTYSLKQADIQNKQFFYGT
jgi:hypothetical protein